MAKKKKAIYYKDDRGKEPAKNFIDGLEDKIRGKILARVEYLEANWFEIRRPLIEYIENKLYALRVQLSKDNVRIIYAYMFGEYIVLLHAVKKKTRRILKKDKVTAKKRMIDFQNKYNEGKIQLK